MSTYFAKLHEMFDELEMEVMNSIKHSAGLQTFLASAEELTAKINDDVIDFVESEHEKMEEKIGNSKFAYLVVR